MQKSRRRAGVVRSTKLDPGTQAPTCVPLRQWCVGCVVYQRAVYQHRTSLSARRRPTPSVAVASAISRSIESAAVLVAHLHSLVSRACGDLAGVAPGARRGSDRVLAGELDGT